MFEVQKAVIKESRKSNDYTLDGIVDFLKGGVQWLVDNPQIVQAGLNLANALLNPGQQAPPPGAQPQG